MIAVTNRQLVRGDFMEQLERVCSVSPRAVLLREKDLSPDEYRELAAQVQEVCLAHDTPLILHSFSGVARELGTGRIHLPLPLLKELDDPSEWDALGTSCHSMEQMREAVSLGATYIFLGNIFETDCKPGLPGKGLDMLREVCAACPVPVYGIGGISEKRLPLLLDAGAQGGCMMSGFMRM